MEQVKQTSNDSEQNVKVNFKEEQTMLEWLQENGQMPIN